MGPRVGHLTNNFWNLEAPLICLPNDPFHLILNQCKSVQSSLKVSAVFVPAWRMSVTVLAVSSQFSGKATRKRLASLRFLNPHLEILGKVRTLHYLHHRDQITVTYFLLVCTASWRLLWSLGTRLKLTLGLFDQHLPSLCLAASTGNCHVPRLVGARC